MNVRPARVEDVPTIFSLIKLHADRGKMILRPLDEIYANLREFLVAAVRDQVVGCAATHIFWSDLAELKCLAVHDDWMGRGLGAALCRACEEEMARLHVVRLFALTNATSFFEKVGYRKVDKDALPLFIWGECVRCPSFPECREDALVKDIATPPRRRGARGRSSRS